MPLNDIKPARRNPKRHAGPAINASIARFGLGELPMLDERTGRLVAGHGRIDQLAAMHQARQQPPDGIKVAADGGWLVPVVRGWRSATDTEADAYLLASNQLTIAGGWDEPELAALLADLEQTDRALLALTGFDDEQTARLLHTLTQADTPDPDPEQPPGPPVEPVTRPGELWLVGAHRIMCGDCRNPEHLATLLHGARPMVVFTSPPYASQRTYDPTTGFQPIHPRSYVDWFQAVQHPLTTALHPKGSLFVNIKEHTDGGQRDLYVYDLLTTMVRRWGWRWVDELCWYDSGNGMPGTWPNRFKDAWERIYHLTRNDKIVFNPLANGHHSEHAFSYSTQTNITLRSGGYVENEPRDKIEGLARPSNVIKISAGREPGFEHTAAFPKQLPAWFVRAYSNPGDHVLDPFAGCGTTAAATAQHDRTALAMDISPGYVDTTLRRLQMITGVTPRRADGAEHDFMTT